MREHAPFHSLALNRSSSMLKKQPSICKSVSLSFLSNEHELVCSKAQMGISGPIQQQGVRYYNNWQLLWFLKGPKVAIWEMVIEQEVGKEWLRVVPHPGLPCAQLTYLSPSSTEKNPVPHHACERLGWILFRPLQEEKIKAHKPTRGRTAAARYNLALADLLAGSPRLAPGCALPDEKAQTLSEKFSYWFSS